MSVVNKKEWYKDLDISSKGKPTGIDQIDSVLSTGICYCITSSDDTAEQADVYQDGQRVHYKKFGYDDFGRVIENAMYSPDNDGEWQIIDDVWYYEYDPETGLRTKKIMKMPGASTAKEISYDKDGNRTGERIVAFNN